MSEKEILPDVKNIKQQETYTLPSKGLIYTKEDNIPSAITLRRMTTREDKLRLRNEGEDVIRKELLQACIVNDIDAGKLKIMDANFLLFRLRSLSLLDDIYKVHCRCPKCSTEFVHEVNLLEVPVQYLTEDKLTNMSVKLPVCQAEIKLKYPSMNDIVKMGNGLRHLRDNASDPDIGAYLYTIGTSIYIESVNGNYLMEEEIEQYLDDLDILDSRALRDDINNLDAEFGFDENLKTKCPSCGNVITHGLPITSELLTPSK